MIEEVTGQGSVSRFGHLLGIMWTLGSQRSVARVRALLPFCHAMSWSARQPSVFQHLFAFNLSPPFMRYLLEIYFRSTHSLTFLIDGDA